MAKCCKRRSLGLTNSLNMHRWLGSKLSVGPRQEQQNGQIRSLNIFPVGEGKVIMRNNAPVLWIGQPDIL